MNEDPYVTLIVPCRNEAKYIETCMRSILRQEPPEGGYEVIVADGMSEDGTRQILYRLASQNMHIRVIDNPGRIVSTGLNRSIGLARGQIIIRIDAHTDYAQDYIKQCVSVLKETGADNVGGAAGTRASCYIQRVIQAAYHSPFSVGGARFHDVSFEGYLDTVTYGCWPKATFEKFGLFDEDLVRNQDDEHNLRIIRGGGKVWQSARIRSWYTPRDSIGQLFRQYYEYGYWKVRVIRKHGMPASIRHLVPGLFVLILLMCIAGAPFLPLFPWAALTVLGSYSIALYIASVITSARTDWRYLPLLPAAYAAYHLGYGIGFVHGTIEFVMLSRPRRSGATHWTL